MGPRGRPGNIGEQVRPTTCFPEPNPGVFWWSILARQNGNALGAVSRDQAVFRDVPFMTTVHRGTLQRHPDCHAEAFPRAPEQHGCSFHAHCTCSPGQLPAGGTLGWFCDFPPDGAAPGGQTPGNPVLSAAPGGGQAGVPGPSQHPRAPRLLSSHSQCGPPGPASPLT